MRHPFKNWKNNLLLQYTILGFVFVSVLGTVAHFVYEWSGQNYFLGFFVSVNESTWEHMKLLFFPMLLYYFLLPSDMQVPHPFALQNYPSAVLIGTGMIPVLYYTYSGILGFQITVLNLLTFYLSVLLAFVSFYYLAQKKTNRKRSNCSYFLLLLFLILFFLFTYNPPNLGIFKVL